MPRGGARPGAGRKRKVPLAPVLPTPAAVAASLPAAFAPTGVKEPETPPQWPFGTEPPAVETPKPEAGRISPLQFLLDMVNNPAVDEKVRLQAAAIAAPFVHVKPVATKKEDAADAAKKAAGGKFSAPATPLRLVPAR